MPHKPLSPCRWQGCPNVCKGKYCEIHQPLVTKQNIKRLKEQGKFNLKDYRDKEKRKRQYNSQRWREARTVFLQEHPNCVVCGKPANVVDHIKPHKGNQQLFWDKRNWQALCCSCHNKKTAREDGGFGHGRSKYYYGDMMKDR